MMWSPHMICQYVPSVHRHPDPEAHDVVSTYGMSVCTFCLTCSVSCRGRACLASSAHSSWQAAETGSGNLHKAVKASRRRCHLVHSWEIDVKELSIPLNGFLWPLVKQDDGSSATPSNRVSNFVQRDFQRDPFCGLSPRSESWKRMLERCWKHIENE